MTTEQTQEDNATRRDGSAVERGVRRLAGWWRILTTPSCWLRNYKTCEEMSRFINVALDLGHEPKRQGQFTIVLEGREFWASNFPYAYGHAGERMPDRLTVFRLAEAAAKAEWRV